MIITETPKRKDTALFLKEHDNMLNIQKRLCIIYIYEVK